MRILYCVGTLGIGGVERHLLDQIPCLASLEPGNDYAVCAFRSGPLAEEARKRIGGAGAELFVLNRRKRFDMRFVGHLKGVAKDWKPHIVHAYGSTGLLWARLALRGLVPGIVAHYRGISPAARPLSRMIERWLLRRTDVCVYNSEATRRVFESVFRIPVPSKVVHNGIDAARHGPPNFERRYDGKRPFRLLSVGRLVPIKGSAAQLRALAEVRRRGRNVELTVVGDGESMAELEALADRLGVAKAVRFEGWQKQVERYYREADAYVSTSYHETFCLTLCEAMLSGLVCIASDAGGPAEIVRDGENGYLVPCEDPLPPSVMPGWRPLVYHGASGQLEKPMAVNPLRLADSVEAAMEHYNELDGLRRSARETIERQFSMERHCRALLDLYSETFLAKEDTRS